MRKILFVAFTLLFVSCGSSYKEGQTIRLTHDMPAADTRDNMEKLEHIIYWDKNKDEAMRMYYLGEAYRFEKGEKFTIKKIKGKYAQVKLDNNLYWIYLPYINDGK